MKKIIRLSLSILAVAAILTATSCWVSYPVARTHPQRVVIYKNTLPPGQVKKVTGAKSAKAYATGQHKKKKK